MDATHMYACVYTYLHCASVCMHVHVHVHTYVHAYMYLHVHMYTCIYMDTCTCVYMMKRLRNIFRELWKTSNHPGLNQGPLTYVHTYVHVHVHNQPLYLHVHTYTRPTLGCRSLTFQVTRYPDWGDWRATAVSWRCTCRRMRWCW